MHLFHCSKGAKRGWGKLSGCRDGRLEYRAVRYPLPHAHNGISAYPESGGGLETNSQTVGYFFLVIAVLRGEGSSEACSSSIAATSEAAIASPIITWVFW